MKKVLIIDDDPDIREVLTSRLEGRKYELREASSRKEGTKALKRVWAGFGDTRCDDGES